MRTTRGTSVNELIKELRSGPCSVGTYSAKRLMGRVSTIYYLQFMEIVFLNEGKVTVPSEH